MPTKIRPILFLLFLTSLLFSSSTATNNDDDDFDLSFLDEPELDTKTTTPDTDSYFSDNDGNYENDDLENYGDFEVPSDFEHEEDNELPSFDESHVVVLTDGNFSDYVDGNKFVLVEFYAPWCGHCKLLAPEYAAAAKELRGLEDVRLVKVDGTRENDLAEEYGIQGFPTLFWFVDGERKAYNGPRTKDGIVTWIKKKIGPGVSNITTIEDAKRILTSENKLVLGFFDSLVGPDSVEFAAASKLEEDVNFYQTSDPKVAKMFHLESNVKKPAVVLIKKEAEKVSFFDGQFKKSLISEFISANKLPLVTNFTRESGALIFESSIKKQVLLFSTANESAKVFSTFEEAAKSFKRKLIFVYVNVDDEETGKPVADYFGVSGDTPKIMGYTGNDDMRKFFLDGEITTEKIKAFGESFLEDKLKAFYKSDPIPETNDGDVKIIVGNNFDDIVLDESKDVLLEIYAPWCGHCEALEPTYNKLAKHLHSVESLVIAKMDGTTNEHPKAKAEGFPTILFFPAGKKNSDPIVVESERTVKGLYKFIKEHATIPFKLQKPASSPVSEDSNAKEAVTSSHADVKDEL